MSKSINKTNSTVILNSLKDFCTAAKITNYVSYSSKIQIVDKKIDSKTNSIAEYILNFYKNCEKKENFYLNLNAIIHYFTVEKKENVSYISLSSVNRALQYINTLENNLIFIIEFFHKSNETFFRIKFIGQKSIITKKHVTSNELFENKVKQNEKLYKSLQEEFAIYNSNNKSLKKVAQFKKAKKEQSKKTK